MVVKKLCFFYICYYAKLMIHPKNAEQLRRVKAILKALKVPFEVQEDKLPEHVLESINKSIAQHESGLSTLFEEFKEKHFKYEL